MVFVRVRAACTYSPRTLSFTEQNASFTLDDANTIVHVNMARNQESMSMLCGMKEFGESRTALKASGPLSPPKSENLNLVDAGFDI